MEALTALSAATTAFLPFVAASARAAAPAANASATARRRSGHDAFSAGLSGRSVGTSGRSEPSVRGVLLGSALPSVFSAGLDLTSLPPPKMTVLLEKDELQTLQDIAITQMEQELIRLLRGS